MKSQALISMLAMCALAVACLNDRDTLGEEARARPDLMWTLVGRFDRNPPEYYTMRIARIESELTQNPADLNQYDDIAVAFDRLHEDDKALAWIEKKRRILGAIPNNQSRVEDWYRTDANQGTFFAHRWFGSPTHTHPEDLRKGRDLIAEALRLKPNAHFGRETYQLAALNWAMDNVHGKPAALVDYVSKVTGPNGQKQSPEEISQGLAGLIRLGGAWESPDVYDAIAELMTGPHRERLGNLAFSRRDELIASGKRLTGKDSGSYSVGALPEEAGQYKQLRAAAEAWNDQRTAFMRARFKQGRHPDTDPAFWDGYKERAFPELPVRSAFSHMLDNPPTWFLMVALALALLILGGSIVLLVILLGVLVTAFHRLKDRIKPQ